MPASLLGVFYFEKGIEGLWWGPTIAIIFNSCFYYVIINKANWNKIAEEVQKRKLLEKK
jgi:Na+-driven multidrug efflux pump